MVIFLAMLYLDLLDVYFHFVAHQTSEHLVFDASIIRGFLVFLVGLTLLLGIMFELELSISSHRSDSRTFELPPSLLMCKTLVVLKLWSNFIINTPTSSGCFPALKSLNVSFDSSDNYSIEEHFSHFPVLEDSTIKAIFPLYGPTEDWNVNISAPNLKRLKVDLHVHGDLQCAFHIDAPNLENLHLRGPVLSSFSLEKAQSLVKAVLSNRYLKEQINCGTALLERISNVKSLYLEAWGLEAYINYEELDLPECVPSCLLSNLKTVSISGFCGMHNQMETAKFFLRNGEGLKKMTVCTESSLDPDEKEAFLKELLIVQMGSKTCKVEFIQ